MILPVNGWLKLDTLVSVNLFKKKNLKTVTNI